MGVHGGTNKMKEEGWQGNIIIIYIFRSFKMALITLRELLDHAAENDYGVPAYNVNNLEQTQGVLEAANETGSPVILQASAGAKNTGFIS